MKQINKLIVSNKLTKHTHKTKDGAIRTPLKIIV